MSALGGAASGPALARLKRRALSLGAANAFDYAMQFLLPIVLVRALDAATFGEYRLLWLAVGTLVGLATLNMPQTLFYFLPRQDAPTRRLYVHHTLLYLVTAGLAAAWIVSPLNPWAPQALAPLGKYGALVPAFLALWITAYMTEVLPVIEERIRLAATFLVGFSALRVVLLATGAFFAEDLELLLWLLVAAVLVKLAAHLVYVQRSHGLGGAWLRPALLWGHFRHAAPFGVSSALYTLRLQADQWIAAAHFALQSFAALTIAALLAPLINVFRQSVNDAFMPSMSRAHAAGDLRGMLALNARANLMVGSLLYPLLAFCFVFAEEIIAIVYTEQYLEAAAVMRVYIAGTVCLVIEVGSIVLLLKQGAFAMRMNAALLVVAVALSLLGARSFGLPGAALGSVAAVYLDRLIMLRRVCVLTGVPFSQVQGWRRLGLTAAAAAAAGALGWAATALWLPEAGPFARVAAGAAVVGLAYLPWLAYVARRQE
ncbi:MAG TPA: oligosaccharide flippase family protein [Burkholderiales bacterium]|nr:oligosaccharide flippase family protein [Burkholderiales bacterium]